MRRFLVRLVEHADAAIVLVVVGCVAVFELAGAGGSDVVNNAILVTLAALAVAALRDRLGRESIEEGVRAAIAENSAVLRELRPQLETVRELSGTFERTERALAELATVRVLNGHEISEAIAEARRTTDRWIFRGGTGTFVRAVTLPDLVDHARRSRRGLRVRMEIIDPTDLHLCERYANLHKGLSEDPDNPENDWTGDGTRREGFATILAACWHRERYQPLDIEIGLSSHMTTFRWEISSTSLIITQRGPRFPAMVFESGKFYYDCWSTELATSLEQARRVPINTLHGKRLSDLPTVDEVRRLFADLGLELPAHYTDEDLADIARQAVHARNPYE